MRGIQSSTGSDSDIETSWEDRDLAASFTGQNDNKELIYKANSLSLLNLFKYYKIQFDQSNKIICPFKIHKGGRENSASFYYYPETNTFWCWGCKNGNRCCDFVSIMDNVSKISAAQKIIKIFSIDDFPEIIEKYNISERLEVSMKFSNAVRNFSQNNKDHDSLLFIDNICKLYDKMNLKHKLTNEALNSMVNQLLTKINSFK